MSPPFFIFNVAQWHKTRKRLRLIGECVKMRKESICSPLLREGGVRGGEARGGSDEGSAATGEETNKVRPFLNV